MEIRGLEFSIMVIYKKKAGFTVKATNEAKEFYDQAVEDRINRTHLGPAFGNAGGGGFHLVTNSILRVEDSPDAGGEVLRLSLAQGEETEGGAFSG